MIAIDDIRKKYGAEMAAIILCCRVFFETASLEELKAFLGTNDIDWYLLVRLARQHRIRPTVYKVLYDADVPADIRVLIYKQHIEITQLNWKHALETERIIMLLKDHGIKAIPYKGAAFSKQFFGDLVSRESSDIDLVIKPEDLDRVRDVLQNDSYLPETDNDIYQYLGKRYYQYNNEYNLNKFVNGRREFHVEFHWAIALPRHGVDARVNQFLYQVDSNVDLVTQNVNALDQTAHFSAIVIHHAIIDTFKYLKNVIDITQALKQQQVQNSAEAINDSFATYGLKTALKLSSSLSQQLTGISLPISGNLKDSDLAPFFERLCSSHRLPVEHKANFAIWIKNRAALQDTGLLKLRYYLLSVRQRFVPTEADFKIVKLPHQFFFVYYLMKPFRSLIKPIDALELKKRLVPIK